MRVLTHVYLSVLQPNTSFYLSKRRLFRRHIVYHLYKLCTANQISRTGEAPHGARVYGRKGRVYEQFIALLNLFSYDYINDFIFQTSPTGSRVINYNVVTLLVQSIFTILQPIF